MFLASSGRDARSGCDAAAAATRFRPRGWRSRAPFAALSGGGRARRSARGLLQRGAPEAAPARRPACAEQAGSGMILTSVPGDQLQRRRRQGTLLKLPVHAPLRRRRLARHLLQDRRRRPGLQQRPARLGLLERIRLYAERTPELPQPRALRHRRDQGRAARPGPRRVRDGAGRLRRVARLPDLRGARRRHRRRPGRRPPPEAVPTIRAAVLALRSERRASSSGSTSARTASMPRPAGYERKRTRPRRRQLLRDRPRQAARCLKALPARGFEGPDARLQRLYSSDFWMPCRPSRLAEFGFGRTASAVPWMKACSFGTSLGLQLAGEVRHAVLAGPLNRKLVEVADHLGLRE